MKTSQNVVFSLLAGATLIPMPMAGQHARYDGPIIDMHLHAKDELWQERRYCFPRPCEGAPTMAESADQLKGLTLAAMERNNIVLGVVSETHERVLPWTEGEERFLTGVKPWRISLDELRELFASGRAQVLGEMTSQYGGIPIDDPSQDPYFALAHDLDLAVHVHVLGIGGSDDFSSHLGNPLRLVPVLRKYPGLRIYVENAGWPFLEEITALMYQYPTVYADISTILHLTPRPVALRYLKGLIDNGLGQRIMFGSDQMIWPEVIDEAVDAIQSAEFLTLEQKADIFYNNAARFLRLSEEEIATHQAGPIAGASGPERTLSAATTGVVEVDGAELGWKREGTGPTIFVLGSSVYYPKAFSERLREHFELVFVDGRHFVAGYQPGEESLAEIDLGTFADDVEAVRRALEYEEITVLGHSIHGQIALEYADKYPATTSRVVLVGAVPHNEMADLRDQLWNDLASEDRKGVLEARLQTLDEVMSGVPPERRFAEKYIHRSPWYWVDPEYDASEVFAGLESSPAFARLRASVKSLVEAKERLRRVRAPILLILGKLDFAVPYTAWEELIEGIESIDYVLLPRDSHNPQTEFPDRFDPILIEWFEDH